MLQYPPDVSTGSGGFEWVFIDGHQMSVVRESLHNEVQCLMGREAGLGPGVPVQRDSMSGEEGRVGTRGGGEEEIPVQSGPMCGEEGTLYNEVQYNMDNDHMRPLSVNRMTD